MKRTLVFTIAVIVIFLFASSAIAEIMYVNNLVANYGMWAYMFGIDIADEPNAFHTDGTYYMQFDRITAIYNPKTFEIISVDYLLMEPNVTSTDENIKKQLAFFAALEHETVPESLSEFQKKKADAFALNELTIDSLENNLWRLYSGNPVEYYKGNKFMYSLSMDPFSRDIHILATYSVMPIATSTPMQTASPTATPVVTQTHRTAVSKENPLLSTQIKKTIEPFVGEKASLLNVKVVSEAASSSDDVWTVYVFLEQDGLSTLQQSVTELERLEKASASMADLITKTYYPQRNIAKIVFFWDDPVFVGNKHAAQYSYKIYASVLCEEKLGLLYGTD